MIRRIYRALLVLTLAGVVLIAPPPIKDPGIHVIPFSISEAQAAVPTFHNNYASVTYVRVRFTNGTYSYVYPGSTVGSSTRIPSSFTLQHDYCAWYGWPGGTAVGRVCAPTGTGSGTWPISRSIWVKVYRG